MPADREGTVLGQCLDGAVTLTLAAGASDVLAVTLLQVGAALGFTTGLK